MKFGYHEIPLRELTGSPTNPRKSFPENELAELADSIQAHGVVQPITARPYPRTEYSHYGDPGDDVMFEIVAGERRWRAAKLAGLSVIPVMIKDLSTREVLEIQIIENLQRRDVNELEEADGYRLMMDQHGYTADELAEKVGKSKAYIYARLKLCDLKPHGRAALLDGKISASVALLIARIPTFGLQKQAVSEVVKGEMSARQAAEHIQGRYTLRLAEAPWALEDATLDPDAGPCIGCPHNTSTNRDAFADAPADVCTSPDCFATKRAEHFNLKAQQLAAAGHAVIRGDQAREIMRYGPGFYMAGFSHIGRHEQCLAEHLVNAPRTYIEYHGDGQLYECVSSEDMLAARAAANAAKRTPEEIDQLRAAEEQRDREAQEKAVWRELEARYLEILFERTRAAYVEAHKAITGPANGLRTLLLWQLEDSGGTDEAMLPFHAPNYVGGDSAEAEEAIDRALATYTLGELLTFQLDSNLLQELRELQRPWRAAGDRQMSNPLMDTARAYGLDPEAIRAELDAPHAGDPVTPAAPQTAETAAPKTASTPTQAARAPDLFADEEPKTPAAPAAENQAAQAPASKTAKAKTTPKTTAQAKPKAPAKDPKSSSRASPAGGKGKTTNSTTAKPKKAKEAA